MSHQYIQQIAPYLSPFGATQTQRIVSYLRQRKTALSEAETDYLYRILDNVNDSFTEAQLEAVKRVIYELFVNQKTLFYDNVYLGEDIELALELAEGDDWSNYIIIGRKNEDNTMVSEDGTVGKAYSVEPTQYLTLPDISKLDLPIGLHKILIQLEENDGTDKTTGEADRVVGEYFLNVLPKDIDQ